MSLRERILVVLLLMLCCYAGVEIIVLKKVIEPELIKQEQVQGNLNLNRCTESLEVHLKNIHDGLSNLARNGKLYALNKDSHERILDSIQLKHRLDFIYVYDNNWNRLWGTSDGIRYEQVENICFNSENPFVDTKIPGFSAKTISAAQDGILFLTSAPLTKSTKSHTVEGTVIAGQYMNQQRLIAFSDRLQLNFDWDFIDPELIVGQNKEIITRLTASQPVDIITLGPELLQISTAIYDYQKQPVLLLKYYQDRSISKQSLHTMMNALYGKLIVGVTAVIILTLLLQRVVITPIIKLIKHIVNIGEPGKRKEILKMTRNDEIGTLASEFDQMCSRLQNAQVKLMEKSYLSGMTEMSSGILHNVRNALSPITTRIDRIKGQFKEIPMDNLEKAQVELLNGSLNSQRRSDLVRFVELTFQDVLDNLKDMVSGLDELAEQVFQIEDMLNMQRTFGREDKPVEFVTPADLLNRALEMVPEKHRQACRISIDSKMNKLPAIPVEPTTFVQIIQNLIINAAESLEKQKPLCRKISIKVRKDEVDGRQLLHWKIEDNGTGIPKEKIQQVFERGASSKRKGLTGIGLHWCANTLTAMKGRIWAESKGEHQGAVFHVLIPMEPEIELVETATGESQ